MKPVPDDESLETSARTRLRLWLRLLKVTRGVEADLREKLRTQFDTTLPRFDVMSALNRYPKGLKMSQLSDVLKVSNGNVTGIVDRLVNDGLIIRSSVPGDRRALLVRLTKRGEEEFLRQAKEHAHWIDEMLGTINLADAEQLIRSFDSVTRTPNEEDNPA